MSFIGLDVDDVAVWRPDPVCDYDKENHLFAGYNYWGTYPQVKAGCDRCESMKHANLGNNSLSG